MNSWEYYFSNSQLTLHFQNSVSRVPKLLNFFISKMHIRHAQNSTSSYLCRQAQEHIATINTIETLSKNRNRVNPSLIAKDGSSQVSNRVTNCP